MSATNLDLRPRPEIPPGRIARTRHVWQLFRDERQNPGPFYEYLAAQAVADIEAHRGSVAGQTVVDLGCGPGFYTRGFRGAGAEVIPIEYEFDELTYSGDDARIPVEPPADATVGDARRLPVRTGAADGIFCSNMLEHTPDPHAVINEMVRVLKPGGWAYLSWTNWYSPWGGHDISPLHYLGPELGQKVHRWLGRPAPKNVPGVNLFPTHIGPILALMRTRTDVVVERVEPRYWPWARPIVKIPGVREVITWNCVIRFRKA